MRNIHKIINIAVIYMIIGVFLAQDAAYPAHYNTLRPEMGFSDDKKEDTENRLGLVEIQAVDKRPEAFVAEEDDVIVLDQLTVNDQVLFRLQALVNKYHVKITRHSMYIRYDPNSKYKRLSFRYAWSFRSLMRFIGKNREVIMERGQDVEKALEAVMVEHGGRTLASGENITRRDFIFRKTPLYAVMGLAALKYPSFVSAGQKNTIKRETRQVSYDFSPARVVASVGGPGFGDARIIESSRTKTVHTITDLEEPLTRKMIQWKWAKSGDSWTVDRWDDGSEAIDLSAGREDMVLRFIVFGTVSAEYKVVLEDNAGQRIEINSTENLITAEGKQYNLARLDELSGRNPMFNWMSVKPVKCVSVSPAKAKITIKSLEILDVKNVRDRGMGIAMFLSKDGIDGNDFPPLGGYAGMTGARPPASILSFSGILERDVDQLTALWNGLLPGQVPHEILEFWLPDEQQSGKLGKVRPNQDLSGLRQKAKSLKARIMAGDKSEDYKTAGWGNVLKRIVNGELDEIFVNRAKAAAQYGKPVILRILHEPTGQWYPWSFSNQQEADDYINAWKHIVQIYRDNGADNVVFVFSPHNYEPDVIQQTRKYQLIDYVMYHLQEHINLIGVDAYSYPPSGGYINALATGLLDLVSKYQIPIMMGETSSAMSEQDKRIFWDYLARDSKNGMFPFIGIGVFSIAKDENGWKDFHPPADIMRTWERDEFFGPNPFGELKGGKRDKTAGLAAPNLPWQDNSRLIADWIYSGGNQEQFTLLPNGMEEWAWGKVSGGWYGWGAAIDIKDKASLNNGTVSNFELRMPLEILEGEFNLVLEDNQGQPVGKEIRLTRDVLFRYIVDGRLVIPIVQVIQFGTGDKALFNWGNIRQVKIEAISDTGKALFGRAVIGKIVNTDVAEDPDNPDRQAMSEPVELEQNYPNPFDDNGTSISYRLSGDSNNVTVRIFNARGRLVRDIGKVDGGAGRHVIKWDGLNKSGNPVATGTYFIQIDVEGRYRKTIKCVKIRGLSAAPVIGTSATLASQQTLTFGSIDIRPEKAGVLFDAFQAIAIDVDRAIKESKIPALAEQLKMRKWRLKEDMVGIMDSINQEGRVILRAIEDSVGRNCNGDIKRRCFNEFSDKWRKMLIMVSNAGNEKDIAFLRRKAEAFLMQIDAYAQLLEDLRSPNKRRIEVNARQFLEENGQPEYTYKFLVYYMGHARGLFHPVSRISAVRGAL